MNLSNISKSIVYLSSTLGLLTVSNLVFINSAGAFGINFSNGGFENNLTDWSSTGDVTVNTGIDGVSPISGNQAILGTGYSNINDRIDDRNSSGNYLDFNQSGTNPIDADTLVNNNSASGDLQSFLNLEQGVFSVARRDSDGTTLPGYRTPKEGSGMYQDIVVNISSTDVTNGTNGFNLNFNWSYLSNDGNSPDFGNQDFSFISIANTPNPGAGIDKNDPNFASGIIELLGDSNQSISLPTADDNFTNPADTTYYTTDNVYTKSVTGLEAGTYSYRVGFGVVDVDSYDRTSTLLVDNFSAEQVPFEFSPTLGLLFVGSVFGFKTALKKMQSKAES